MPRFGAATKSIFWHAAADGATAPTPRQKNLKKKPGKR